MAQLLMESRQFTEAIPRAGGGVTRKPEHANRVALAKAYCLARQLDKALPLLEQAVAAEPGNYDLRMMYARALRDRKQFGAAAAHFYEAAKIKPAEARPGANWAVCCT